MAQTDPPVRNKLLTLDAFVSQVYLPYVKLRKRSWRIDERMARKHLSPVFGDKPITKIRRCEVDDWFHGLLAKGFAPVSCNRFLAVFQDYLRCCRRTRIFVCRQISMPGRRFPQNPCAKGALSFKGRSKAAHAGSGTKRPYCCSGLATYPAYRRKEKRDTQCTLGKCKPGATPLDHSPVKIRQAPTYSPFASGHSCYWRNTAQARLHLAFYQ